MAIAECFTRHSSARSVQRRIPPSVVEWLLEFGTVRRVRGADVWFFDKKGRDRLRRHLGEPVVDRLGKLLDVYAVMNEGRVITVAYRLKRLLTH